MDSLSGADAAQTSSGYRHTPSANSALGGSKVDESFIVLDNGSKKGAQGGTVSFFITECISMQNHYAAKP